MALRKRRIIKRKLIEPEVTTRSDFSKGFPRGTRVTGQRVSHGVHLDVRAFPSGSRHSLVLCYGGSVAELQEWLGSNAKRLDKVARELARRPAPGGGGQ